MSTTALPPSTPAQTRRAVANTLKGSLGNLVEWYDVYAYTVFVKYFEHQFFAKDDTNSTVYAYAVFAVTFLMRPLGSWYFGRYADRHGRRAALTFSVSLMALASMVIALMPTRATLGVWAAVVLILCRLVQGFATGGEYGTSATYMSEAATRERRGFFSSFQYVTLVGGQVLATLTLLILLNVLSEDQLNDWGWRVPFFIGGVSALIVLWLRRTMDESLTEAQLEAVREGRDTSSGSMRELLTQYLKPLLLVFFITMGGTLAFYVYSVNAPAIVKATYKDSAMTSTLINLFALLFLLVLQPVGGMISDRIGRKPLLVFFGIGSMVFTWALITYLPKIHSPLATFGLLAVAYVILTGYTSINALVKSELFPAHIRALGVGLGYGLANSCFGGTAPLLYEAAKTNGHVSWFIAYATIASAISLFVYVRFLTNKGETHLDREQGHAYTPRDSTRRTG